MRSEPWEDASRRTWLAGERTLLAWVRNGLGALALAIAMGRIVPQLGNFHERWPYTVAGAGYALAGVGFIAYGVHRQRQLSKLFLQGEFQPLPWPVTLAIGGFGVVLALLTLALLFVSP